MVEKLFLQKIFHIKITELLVEKEKGLKAYTVSREEFSKMCMETVEKYEKEQQKGRNPEFGIVFSGAGKFWTELFFMAVKNIFECRRTGILGTFKFSVDSDFDERSEPGMAVIKRIREICSGLCSNCFGGMFCTLFAFRCKKWRSVENLYSILYIISFVIGCFCHWILSNSESTGSDTLHLFIPVCGCDF